MLKARKQIKRREIQEDPLTEKYKKAVAFFETYSKYINIGLIVFAVVIVGSIMMIRSKKNAELAASAQIGLVSNFYFAERFDDALPQLQTIVDTYTGTRGAGTAVFYLANIYYKKEDFAKAKEYYNNYLSKYHQDDLISASSLAGLAACEEKEDNMAEAARLYEKAGRQYKDLFNAPMYLNEAARCLLSLGQTEKARDLYREIIENYSDSDIANEVKFTLESI